MTETAAPDVHDRERLGEKEVPRHALLPEIALLIVSTTLTTSGITLFAVGLGGPADVVWTVAAVLGTAAATWWVIEAARERRLGVDIVTILALVGALLVGEPFAAAVIAVMLASGRALEARASGRAR